MKHPLIGFSLSFLGAVLFASSASAQGRGGSFFNQPATAGGSFFNAPSANGFMHGAGPGAGRARSRSARGRRFRHLYAYPYGYGDYWPYYDSDSGYDDGDELAPPPRAAAPAKSPEPQKAADSVVMELRGDRWVRITTTGPVEVATPSASERPAVLPAFDLSPAAAPLPAAILVFRDGHQEEISKYTIVGRTIFLKSDYWSTGNWTRKISIADLDIPATLKLNSDRGTKFALPSRPSEIILRP